MKKILMAVLFLACGLTAFSQEKKMSAGLGLEWNMDSRHNFAGGTLFNFDFKLPRFMTLGLTVKGSSNFKDTYVIEPALMFRAYKLENEYKGFYFQYDLGASIIKEEDDVWTVPLVAVGAGYRFHLGSSFYIEPYGRLGYPVVFGIGAVAGIRF